MLEVLNVKNIQDGFKKLFKLFHLIEIMVSKVTELEAIILTKYDDLYNSFVKGNSTLNLISGFL